MSLKITLCCSLLITQITRLLDCIEYVSEYHPYMKLYDHTEYMNT